MNNHCEGSGIPTQVTLAAHHNQHKHGADKHKNNLNIHDHIEHKNDNSPQNHEEVVSEYTQVERV